MNHEHPNDPALLRRVLLAAGKALVRDAYGVATVTDLSVRRNGTQLKASPYKANVAARRRCFARVHSRIGKKSFPNAGSSPATLPVSQARGRALFAQMRAQLAGLK